MNGQTSNREREGREGRDSGGGGGVLEMEEHGQGGGGGGAVAVTSSATDKILPENLTKSNDKGKSNEKVKDRN